MAKSNIRIDAEVTVTYPLDHEFVVQFSSDTDPTRERMIGRTEHLESGRRIRFNSLEELGEFLKQVLTAPTVVSRK